MYCIEQSILATLLGLFGAPETIRRPGNCVPLSPRRYAPGYDVDIPKRFGARGIAFPFPPVVTPLAMMLIFSMFLCDTTK